VSDATGGPTPGRSDDELDQLVRDVLGEVSEERFRAMIAAAVSTEQHGGVEPVGHDDAAGPGRAAEPVAGPVAELRSSRSRPGARRWNLRSGFLAAAASITVIAGAVVFLSPKDQGEDVAGAPNTGSPTATAVAGPTAPTSGVGPCELSDEAGPASTPTPDAPTIPRREFWCSIQVPGAGRAPDVVLFDDGRLLNGLVVPEQSLGVGRGWGCIQFGEPRSVEAAGALPAGPGSTVAGGMIFDQADTPEGTEAAELDYGGATCDGSGLSVSPTGPGRFELPYSVRYCFTLDTTQTTADLDLPGGALQIGGGVGCRSGVNPAEPDGVISIQVSPAT